MTIPSWLGRTRPDDADTDTRQWRTAVLFAVGLCVATGSLVWLSYIATRQWQRGTELLQERRAAEALALAHAALVRDMKGAWVSFVVPIDQRALEDDPPYELLHRSAESFAKFPYVEAVVVWRGDSAPTQTYAFIRSDRQPAWDRTVHPEDSFPVLMLRDGLPFQPVIDMASRADSASGPFALIETTIDGVPYQFVAHVLVGPAPAHTVIRVVALAINLDWVRRNYFKPILSQISSIGGVNDSVAFSVSDDQGHVLAETGPASTGGGELQRRFPFIFLESTALRAGALPRPVIKDFVVHVRQVPGTAGVAALSGAFRILLLIVLAAMASIVALLQTVRAVRGSVRLALMKSEFVSAVTHELKTPLVTIRLIGDTLAGGRYASPETIREYAQLLSQEAGKLSQSIDHLLTYARYSETMPQAAFAAVDVSDVVEDAAERFRPTLAEREGTLHVDVPRDLPRVRIDTRAISQALEIVLDNAIKYSVERPSIDVSARVDGQYVRVAVTDKGCGIHPDDLLHVRERFFRGRNAAANGSGLGLAIAQRIVQQNGGDLRIQSKLGAGTEVHVLLRPEQA